MANVLITIMFGDHAIAVMPLFLALPNTIDRILSA